MGQLSALLAASAEPLPLPRAPAEAHEPSWMHFSKGGCRPQYAEALLRGSAATLPPLSPSITPQEGRQNHWLTPPSTR